MLRKKIVLGQIPDNFDFNSHIPFSSMCFVGRESTLFNWEENDFESDPFTSADFHAKCERLCKEESYYLLETLRNELNNRFELNLSTRFWKTILFPWLPYTVNITYERQLRVEKFIEKYRDQDLELTLMKDNIEWDFRNCSDFMNNGLKNPFFNEWLVSRLMETQIPSNWTTEVVDKSSETYSSFYSPRQSLSKKLIKKSRLLHLRNGFGRVFEIHGFKFIDFVFYNILLTVKKSGLWAENQTPTFGRTSQIEWKYDIKTLLERVTTQFIYEVPDHIEKIKKRYINNKLNLISAAQITNSDNRLKVKLALKKEFGERIISVQHGGHNYGTSRYNSTPSLVEYNQDCFITWGWTEQQKYSGNFHALPSPYMSNFYNRHNQTDDSIILVGNYMNPYFYSFTGYPNSNQLIDYRKNKVLFIRNIEKEIRANLMYRPYVKRPYSFQDEEYMKRIFPDLNIVEGNLHSKMLNCKLLILDHPGTTLLIALAANIPVVCFWSRSHFAFSSQAQKYYEMLHKLGIVYDSPKSAAEHVNNLEAVKDWWFKDEIQNVRMEILKEHARVSDNWRFDWLRFLIKL